MRTWSTILSVAGGPDAKKELSRNAKVALSVVDTQPGADFARGSFWQLFNAVSFNVDHLMGRTQDSRLQSAWYGSNRNVKTKALETALEMANA